MMASIFLGPVMSPTTLLVAELGERWPKAREKQRTRLVIDDYGNAVMFTRRCCLCRRWKPLTFEHFAARGNTAALGMQAKCRACSLIAVGQWYWRDPEVSRAKKNELYRSLMSRSEESRRLRRERNTANARKRRAEDPEGFQRRRRAARNKYIQKMQANPVTAEELRERNRMAYRLRRERETGVHIDNIRNIAPRRVTKGGVLPALPLGRVAQAAVERLRLTDEAAFPEAVGCHARQINAWLSGGIIAVHFDGSCVGANGSVVVGRVAGS